MFERIYSYVAYMNIYIYDTYILSGFKYIQIYSNINMLYELYESNRIHRNILFFEVTASPCCYIQVQHTE